MLIPQIEGEQDTESLFASIEINSLLKECCGNMKVIASSKGVTIIENLCQDEFYFNADASKFKRAIINLLSNGVKFTPKGGTVLISSSVKKNSLLIKIMDSGIGIPKSIQPIIFNKFTRAKRVGTEGESTVGLGLFITKQIMELHNALLWFESEEGKGTTFYIKLR